jgi:hypothetical protein
MSRPTNTSPTLEAPLPQQVAGACPHCGAPVDPDDPYCPACGAEMPLRAEAVAGPPAQRHFRCKNCGAEVSVDFGQRSYTCAFCDSNYVMEFTPEQSGRQPPEFVIGFAVTPEQARERFRQWLASNSWFRPGDLRMAQVEGKLRGVYLPFWSFSMLARSNWAAQIGEYWYRTETYTTRENGKTVTRTRTVRETEWWDLSGNHHRYYSGYLVSGSRGLQQIDAERIKPFHLAALKRYRPYFLAGWLSEEYSVGRDEALGACQQEFYRREQQNVAGHLPGDTNSGLRVETRFSDVNSDLILLPVYLLSYRYGEKLYRFLLNGQTGKASGDKPLSGLRIGLAVAAGLIVIAVVVLTLLLLGNL